MAKPVNFMTILAALFALLSVAGCRRETSPTPAPTVQPEQQIVFHNGLVLTMNPDQPQASALLVTGEQISAVGEDAEILGLVGANATIVDLQGATLMPGFVDPHSHLFNDSEQYLELTLAEVQQLALENGITALGDMYVTEDFLGQMEKFDEQGRLQIRTSLYLVATDNCGNPQGEWWQAYPTTSEPGELLRIAGVKIFTDGGTCGRPALSYELTPGEGTGDLFFSQGGLNDLVTEIHQAGRQVAIHAIGDRAIEQAQNAISAALAGQPNTLRHRIDHNSVIRPELLPRYGEIGIVPLVFGLYPICEPFGPPPPEAYLAWEWPTRSLLDANPGLPIAWHGDDPWFGRVRPLDDLYSLVTRNEVASDGLICPAPAWHQAQRLTAAEALPMMTLNAAYALFREGEIGSLQTGKFADLLILSANPLAINPESIPEIDIWLTMVGGRSLYCAPGREGLCP